MTSEWMAAGAALALAVAASPVRACDLCSVYTALQAKESSVGR